MDLQGSLVDTNLRIYPSNNLIKYFKSIKIDDHVPDNIIKFVKGATYEIKKKTNSDVKVTPISLNNEDIKNLNKIKAVVQIDEDIEILSDEEKELNGSTCDSDGQTESQDSNHKVPKLKEDFNEKAKSATEDRVVKSKKSKEDCNEETKNKSSNKNDELHLTTADIDWLYEHLQNLRNKGEKDVPYLHNLLEGSQIGTPDNEILKRNPVLEARCVKLRAQQEAREYRKMTKSVDNVRMRFPEDSISYQLKQVNRQLIAIGQFIISIFAGFLFGFKGVEWMIGSLDFGFRLLLGVMCALIIALAEIYFLAKKLNEELNIPETVQLGGPPKFVDQESYGPTKIPKKAIEKEHKD